MSVKNLSKRGMNGSYNFNLEEVLGARPPFDFLTEPNKDVYYEDFLTESQVANYRKESSSDNKNTVPINEATSKELISGADSKRRARAKLMTTKYFGVTGARGWITFKTNSQYTPSIKYTQYIKLKEAKDMKYFKEFKKQDIIRLFLSGDLQVYCSCPDFKYRQKHMAYGLGYGIFKETRYPKIRNPKLEGTVCKHLICVLSVLSSNWLPISKDMKNSKFFKRKYQDDAYMKELINKASTKNSSSNKKK